jgi:hypothetical protein
MYLKTSLKGGYDVDVIMELGITYGHIEFRKEMMYKIFCSKESLHLMADTIIRWREFDKTAKQWKPNFFEVSKNPKDWATERMLCGWIGIKKEVATALREAFWMAISKNEYIGCLLIVDFDAYLTN